MKTIFPAKRYWKNIDLKTIMPEIELNYWALTTLPNLGASRVTSTWGDGE
jgi:hypothetical protein